MTEEQVNNNFEEYIDLISTHIKREGVDKLINWLKSKDTKIAPASTRYHLSCPGGLVLHSMHVYDRLKKLIASEYATKVISGLGEEMVTGVNSPYSDETVALVALLHDISKVELYEIQERNTKDENGNWIKVPYYQVKQEQDRFVFGSHSMNSYYLLSKFFNLTYEESLAVLHHMGGLDSTEDTISQKNLAEAYKKSTLALLLHIADMQATFIDEVNVE